MSQRVCACTFSLQNRIDSLRRFPNLVVIACAFWWKKYTHLCAMELHHQLQGYSMQLTETQYQRTIPITFIASPVGVAPRFYLQSAYSEGVCSPDVRHPICVVITATKDPVDPTTRCSFRLRWMVRTERLYVDFDLTSRLLFVKLCSQNPCSLFSIL